MEDLSGLKRESVKKGVKMVKKVFLRLKNDFLLFRGCKGDFKNAILN